MLISTPVLVSGQWGAAADDQHQQPGKVKVQAFQSYPCFALCVRQMINIKLHITTISHHTDKSENIRQQQFWISFFCLGSCAVCQGRKQNKFQNSPFSNNNSHLPQSSNNVFICLTYEIKFSQLQHVFVQIMRCIFPNYKIYLSKSSNKSTHLSLETCPM